MKNKGVWKDSMRLCFFVTKEGSGYAGFKTYEAGGTD